MQVQLRYKRSERTQRRGRHGKVRGIGAVVTAPRPIEPIETEPVAPVEIDASAVGRLRRPANTPLSGDEALYNCSCGFAFEATVSTSVACPHCGHTQAW